MPAPTSIESSGTNKFFADGSPWGALKNPAIDQGVNKFFADGSPSSELFVEGALPSAISVTITMWL